ncbi:hypothetical protein [Nostoc sp.]
MPTFLEVIQSLLEPCDRTTYEAVGCCTNRENGKLYLSMDFDALSCLDDS